MELELVPALPESFVLGDAKGDVLQVALPLSLFCQLVAPQQAAVFKVTLDTNRPPPQLVELFQDMVAQAQVWSLGQLNCTWYQKPYLPRSK